MANDNGRRPAEPDEARRAELRALCRPRLDGPRPRSVNVLGWIMVGVALHAAGILLAILGLSIRDLFAQKPFAGEDLFAAAVGLTFTLFFARVWHGFRTLPDWCVALDVPFRVKLFAAAGSALSASLAALWLAVLIFAVCAKTRFLDLMERLGAADVSKVYVLLASAGAFFLFVLLWYVFQAVMELREWSRPALGFLFLAIGLLAGVGAAFAGGTAGGAATTALCAGFAVLAALGLLFELLSLGGASVARHFRADEP